jgi:hypothetical protein
MDVYKCKLCGGNIEFEPGSLVGICDNCKAKVELSFSEDVTNCETDTKTETKEPKSAADQKPNSNEKAGNKNKAFVATVAAIALVGIIAGLVWILLPKNTNDINSPKVGDTVRFGHYDDKDEWIVLDKKGEKLLILNKYGIKGTSVYNWADRDVTWSTCYLRWWLNNEYLFAAFSEEEMKNISDTRVKNANNPEYGTPGGSDTVDKVFLLSIEEANKYFADDAARILRTASHYNENRVEKNTEVAYPHGQPITTYQVSFVLKYCWWLRTPGNAGNTVAYVDYNGFVIESGMIVTGGDSGFDYIVTRPAMWVDQSVLERVIQNDNHVVYY